MSQKSDKMGIKSVSIVFEEHYKFYIVFEEYYKHKEKNVCIFLRIM